MIPIARKKQGTIFVAVVILALVLTATGENINPMDVFTHVSAIKYVMSFTVVLAAHAIVTIAVAAFSFTGCLENKE